MERLHPMMKYGNFIEVYNNYRLQYLRLPVSSHVDGSSGSEYIQKQSSVTSCNQRYNVIDTYETNITYKTRMCAFAFPIPGVSPIERI